MTYTAVNPHACCNWPRPEDAHAAARSPPHPHASPHLTNNGGLRWKTDGRPPANGPPTATPQQRRHSTSTPARGPPSPPSPRPSPQQPPPPSQSQGQIPITEQNFPRQRALCGHTHTHTPGVCVYYCSTYYKSVREGPTQGVWGKLRPIKKNSGTTPVDSVTITTLCLGTFWNGVA